MNSTQATENMLGQDKVSKYLDKIIDKNRSLKILFTKKFGWLDGYVQRIH